jgi:hypothetical protein
MDISNTLLAAIMFVMTRVGKDWLDSHQLVDPTPHCTLQHVLEHTRDHFH